MTGQTELFDWFDEIRVVARSVYVMAAEARDTSSVHQALGEIISLHAILMGGAVREMREGCLPELVLLEFPEVLQ
jgi:hypothetical protein